MLKAIKIALPVALLSITSTSLHAANIFTLFKDEHGNTIWQHLANWTSGSLILILTAMSIKLFFSARREKRANHALEEIRAEH